jgi:hypothetical protein
MAGIASVFRSFPIGAADVAALDRDVIGYVQLCDAPLVSRFSEYTEDAKFERMAPGTGELPLLGCYRLIW